jgi:hypothetical protein
MVMIGAMAARRGALGMVGDGLAIPIAVILAVASLGESFAEGPVTAPRAVLIGSGLLGILLALLIVGAVIHDVRLRRRSHA